MDVVKQHKSGGQCRNDPHDRSHLAAAPGQRVKQRVRERNGRKEAVVQVEGKSIQAPGSKQTVSGSVKGLAWVEIDTGVVVEATISKEFEFDTSSEGVKKHISGENEYKITRGAAQ